MLKKLFLPLAGLCAGFINGLLGTGGGIIIIFALGKLFPDSDPKDNFASAIACILPMSIVSAGFYLTGGSVAFGQVMIYILPAIIGGIFGALLLCRIKTALLKKIFAGLVIWAGLSMIMRN